MRTPKTCILCYRFWWDGGSDGWDSDPGAFWDMQCEAGLWPHEPLARLEDKTATRKDFLELLTSAVTCPEFQWGECAKNCVAARKAAGVPP